MANGNLTWEPIGEFDYLTWKVRLTFVEGLLGTSPDDPEIYGKYIASKAPDPEKGKEETKAKTDEEKFLKAFEMETTGMNIFNRLEDGTPFLYDYQIKGFFKDACKACRMMEEAPNGRKLISPSIKAYKTRIDDLVFIRERIIPIHLSGEITYCERPLRASTAQGERIALACSEEAPAGSYIDMTIICSTKQMHKGVEEWLHYGALKGIGGWRNSGKGRFTWDETERLK